MSTYTPVHQREDLSGAPPCESTASIEPSELNEQVSQALQEAFKSRIGGADSLDTVVGSGHEYWRVRAGDIVPTISRVTTDNLGLMIGRVHAVQELWESAHYRNKAEAQNAPCIRAAIMRAAYVFHGNGREFRFHSIEFPGSSK